VKIWKRNAAISAAIVVVLIVLDQWVKALAVANLKNQPGYSFLGNFVRVEYAENRGAFLSLGAGLSDEARLWIFVFGVVLILAFCLYSLVKSIRHLPSVVAFSLVIAGGVGNLVDRALQHYVVDYIHMGFGWLRTGVFNLADVAISAGLLFLVYLQYCAPAANTPKETSDLNPAPRS
jgi:signal peptidase II